MNRITPLLFMLSFLLLTATGQEQPSGPLVTAQWLKEHVNDRDQVILHVAFNRREYSGGHIPGAQFVWWDWIVPSTPDYSSELPTPAEAQKLLRSLGVSNTTRIIVVFGRTSLTSGTRPLWTLTYFGLGDHAFLLDGGMEAWKAAGGKVVTEVLTPNPGTVTLQPRPQVLADAEYVKKHLNDPNVTIIDARSRVYYDGRPTGQPKAGHIEGAVSVPYSEVVDSLTKFKSPDALKKLFEDAGVKEGSTVVTYCHVGQQATQTLLAARLLGYDVRMYDGSFEDWSYQDETFPVVTPEKQE